MVSTRTKHGSKTAPVSGAPKKPVANGAAVKKQPTKAKAKAKAPAKNKKVSKPVKPKSAKAKKTKQPSDDEQYDVEHVRGVRIKGNVTEYFIKWSGYSERDNSWEPAGIVSCGELVRKFLQGQLDDVKADAESGDEAA